MQLHVSKTHLFFFMTLWLVNPNLGQATISTEDVQNPAYAKDYLAAKTLQQALHDNNRRIVANLIQYPLARDQPLRPLKDSKEFMKHWDEYFDSTTIPSALAAKAGEYGWRGIALSGGIVWFKNGRIISINFQTKAYHAALLVAKKIDDLKLYVSARGYDKLTFQCRTKTHFIRVQQHGAELRYFSWKTPAMISTKPTLELHGGKYDPQGTGGNFILKFKNEGFTYNVDVGHNLCGEDCNDHLVVQQDSKIISSEVCTEVRP